MNDTATLEFPTIEAPPSPQTAVAAAAAQALDLEKMDLRAIALSAYKPAREQAAEAVKALTSLVHDLSTQAKVDAAKSLRQRLINAPVADVRKLTKGIKSKLASVSKDVGAEEEAVLAEFAKAEKLITPQIEAREAELEAEREARIQAEAARKAKHEINLQRLSGAAQRAREKGATSVDIANGIEALIAFQVGESWEEYRERAEAARKAAIEDLQKLHSEVRAREDQAAENERLRLLAEQQAAELERLRAAEAERAAGERFKAAYAAAVGRVGILMVADAIPDVDGRTDPMTADEMTRLAEVLDSLAIQPPPAPASTVVDDSEMTKPWALPKANRTEYTEGHPPQQVVKAEPATADATDRGTDADASPGGGPMGAGQPAAAGPAGEPRVIFVEPEPADPLDDARAFVALVLTAFNTKFPTQPKPAVEWWAQVRQAGEALRDKLGDC